MTIDETKGRETLHGSCVSTGGAAVLLIGASGSGKSATALDLIALGATLVSDDQVVLTRRDNAVFASCPEGFHGKIEARGIGILNVDFSKEAEIKLVVDLDQTELHRLPPQRKYEILGIELDLIYGRDNLHLTAGVWALLRGSREH